MPENLWELVEASLDRYREKTAWVARGPKGRRTETSYAQLHSYAEGLAASLRELGVAQGDHVGILSSNGPHWGAAAFGVWKLGAVVAPMHAGNSDEELQTQAKALTPKLILYHGANRGLAGTVEIILDGERADNAPAAAASAGEEAVRLYTSGSTGNPKMVRLSHGNVIANVVAASRVDINISPGDRFLSLLPLSHAMEMTGGMLLPFYCGATVVLPRVIAANEILQAMEEEQITLMIAVPRLFRNIMLGMEKRFREGGALLRAYVALLRGLPAPLTRMLNAPLRRKFGGRINCWLSGGSRLDPQIGRYFRELGFPLIQGYGLTECSPVVSVQSKFDPVIESVGEPLQGVEVRIEKPDDSGAGELWVRGPNVMLGYADDRQTREVMHDGWYKTGDIARLVDGRKIVLTGRSKRLIVTEAGKNVYPEDLEIMLERHPDLKEAGVVEVDVRPAAVLAIDEPDQLDKARAIIKEFNSRVSSHNHIVRYAIVDELPRTPLGKVALKDLPAIFDANEVKR